MTDVDDWDWDDPLRDWEGKTEPDCFDCCDSHPRGCPGCDPTLWHRFVARIRWTWRRLTTRGRRSGGTGFDDEMPF